MQEKDIAVLVLSCDKYADLWYTFYSFFFKYWNDCPYKIYHASNYKSYPDPRIANIQSGLNSDWSSETKAILKQIPEKYVVIILDDYFIFKPVDTSALKYSMQVMEKYNALFLKLACFPKSHKSLWEYDKLSGSPTIGKIKSGMEYRINLQVGAWNTDLFYDLIKEGESPWQFEVNGSKRTKQINNPCLCIDEAFEQNSVYGPITYLCSALTKGVWMLDAIELCKKEGIPVDTGKRKIETRFEYWLRKIYTKTPLSKRKYIDFVRKFYLISILWNTLYLTNHIVNCI